MSRPLGATPVLPFFGLLFREDIISIEEVTSQLSQLSLGDLHLSFELREAKLRDYYQKEMGPAEKLSRYWIFDTSPMVRDELVSLKIKANKLEEDLVHKYGATGRVVNIDPGYVALEQVVLSTCKPYGHRIYLKNQVYGELTYQFQGGEFNELPWTYPDYREQDVKHHFKKARSFLKDIL